MLNHRTSRPYKYKLRDNRFFSIKLSRRAAGVNIASPLISLINLIIKFKQLFKIAPILPASATG